MAEAIDFPGGELALQCGGLLNFCRGKSRAALAVIDGYLVFTCGQACGRGICLTAGIAAP